MIEAFFRLTNKELRLALERSGSNQLTSMGGALKQPAVVAEGAADLGCFFLLPLPGACPIRKQMPTPGEEAQGPTFSEEPTREYLSVRLECERLLSLQLAHKRSPMA